MRRTHAIAAATSLTITAAMLVARPALALAFAPRGDIAACDPVGDRRQADDCLRHTYLRSTKDGSSAASGKTYLRLDLHRSQRGKAFVGEVQYRRVDHRGVVTGPWRPQAGFRLLPQHTKDGVVGTIISCAPDFPGQYEMRVVLGPSTGMQMRMRPQATSSASPTPSATSASPSATPSATPTPSASATASGSPSASATASPSGSATGSGTGSATASPSGSSTASPSGSPSSSASGTASPSPSPSASTDDLPPGDVASRSTQVTVTQPTSCMSGPGDQVIVEYYNQEIFDSSYSVTATRAGSTVGLSLSCPPPISPEFPPSTMSFVIATESGSASTGCGGPPITMSVPSTSAAPTETFKATLSNSGSGTIYSTTFFSVTFDQPSQVIEPQFEPATLPICNNTLSFGVTGLPGSTVGQLSLCDAGNCPSPSGPVSYSLNSSVYFQLALRDTVVQS